MDTVDVVHSLGKIEGKLDTLAVMMQNHVEGDTKQFFDLNAKVDKINRKQSWMVGVGSGVVAAVTSVIAFLKV